MTVKADGPADVDRRTEHKGSSVGTPGMSALDEEREASLADEGGASGAVIESQDLGIRRRPASEWSVSDTTRRGRTGFWFVAGALAAGALGTLALRKRR
jgi:hypothetical protein